MTGRGANVSWDLMLSPILMLQRKLMTL
jgi:hypothetical protein